MANINDRLNRVKTFVERGRNKSNISKEDMQAIGRGMKKMMSPKPNIERLIKKAAKGAVRGASYPKGYKFGK